LVIFRSRALVFP